MTHEPTTPPPGAPRTWAASQAKRLGALRRLADRLERAGWTCTPPAGVPRHAPIKD